MDSIMQALAHGESAESVLRRETLRMAVCRKITCDLTGAVLDVRTAVLIETTGQMFVLPGAVFDQVESRLREGIAAQGWGITDIVDGRKL